MGEEDPESIGESPGEIQGKTESETEIEQITGKGRLDLRSGSSETPLLTRPGPHRVSEHRLEGQTQLVSELHFLTYDQVADTQHGISDPQSSSRPADANAVPVTAVLLPAKLMLIPAGS